MKLQQIKPFFLSHWNYLMKQRSCTKNSPTILLRGMGTQQNWEETEIWSRSLVISLHTASHTQIIWNNCHTSSLSLLHSFISRNAVFTCMWFTVRTNQNQSTLSLSSLRPTLRWVGLELSKDFSFFFSWLRNTFSLFCFLTGSQAAVGSQAAAQWSAHQTCSEDHEVSATAEVLLFNMTMYLHAWHCYMLPLILHYLNYIKKIWSMSAWKELLLKEDQCAVSTPVSYLFFYHETTT